jgi:hypothetical protein
MAVDAQEFPMPDIPMICGKACTQAIALQCDMIFLRIGDCSACGEG